MTSGLNYILGTSLLITVILLLRKIWGRKCNPNIQYFLWIFVAVRILVPLEIEWEVPAGILQEDRVTEAASETGQNIRIEGGDFWESYVTKTYPEYEGSVNNYNGTYSDRFQDDAQGEGNPIIADTGAEKDILNAWDTSLKHAATFIWFTGSVVMAAYVAISNTYTLSRIKKRKVWRQDDLVDVYETEQYNCLVGILKPRIYMSAQVLNNEETRKYVLQHEMQHYLVRDNIWMLLRTICLIVQWFNPLVWAAYRYSREDCELACDYRVIKALKAPEREEYAEALLQVLRIGVKREISFVTSAGNNKRIMRKRLENIFKDYKWKWAVGVSAMILVLMIGCLTFISLRSADDRGNTDDMESSADVMQEQSGEEAAGTDKAENADKADGDDQTGAVSSDRQGMSAVDHTEEQGNISEVSLSADLDMDAVSEDIWVENRVENGVQYHVVKVKNQEGQEAELLYKVRNQEPGDSVRLQVAPLNQTNNLIVSIPDITSNYGSTDIHILHLQHDAQGIQLVEDLTILDGGEASLEYEKYKDTFMQTGMSLVSTPGEILTLEDGRNVLKVEKLSTQGDDRRYVYWRDTEWVALGKESYIAQWDLIACEKENWLTFQDYANELQKYTVADMDENGRLEVIVTSMGGTGAYSYTHFYEVNETFDGLTECTTDFAEGDSQPDFVNTNGESNRVFRDAQGKLHYIFTDFLHAGTEYYDIFYDVTLEDGHITHEALARKHESYGSGSSVITYKDAAGQEITEEAYLTAVDRRFSGSAELIGLFDWRELKEIAELDEAAFYTQLSGIHSGLVRGNVIMEAEAESWMERFGAEFYENEHYLKAINDLRYNRVLPDGKEAYASEGDSFGNSMAFLDMDQDGRKELLLNIGGTCMADMGVYVYQLDESMEGEYKFRQELAVWPDIKFYDNGIVLADKSHNHGYSNNDDFWPYDVYEYDKEADVYRHVRDVDAWEKELKEVDYDGVSFPDDKDVDGDGMVYRIQNMETEELILMDTEEYEGWYSGLLQDADERKIYWVYIPE